MGWARNSSSIGSLGSSSHHHRVSHFSGQSRVWASRISGQLHLVSTKRQHQRYNSVSSSSCRHRQLLPRLHTWRPALQSTPEPIKVHLRAWTNSGPLYPTTGVRYRKCSASCQQGLACRETFLDSCRDWALNLRKRCQGWVPGHRTHLNVSG